MISAAVKGLARLAYEFSDLITAAYNLLPSTFLLLQRKNKEIIKVSISLSHQWFSSYHQMCFFTHLFLVGTSLTSFLMQANLGLMKVLVAKSQAEGLQTHLKSMVEGLLKWQDDSKSHFKAKVCVSLCNLILHLGLQLHVVSISSLPCYSWNLSSCFNQGTSDTVSNII